MNGSILQVIESLESAGVSFRIDGEKVKAVIPDPALPDVAKALEILRQRKGEVRAILEGKSRKVETVPQGECKQCDGEGECRCHACTLRRTENAVPRLMCRPRERQAWLAATRPERCWHCSGSGKCKCISCDESGACRVCGGSGRVTAWLQ